MESITLSTPNSILSSLLFIAIREGYFERAGLRIQVMPTSTGLEAIGMALSGRTDIAVAASVPISNAILNDADPHIVATIAKSDRDLVVVANRKHGIRELADLRGKKVAVKAGTSFAFYLDAALIDAGLTPSDVQLVDLPPDAAAKALAEERVDAAVLGAPSSADAIRALGSSAVSLAPPLYTIHWNLVASDRFMKERSATIEKMLDALLDAEDFARRHPERAITVAADWLHSPRDSVAVRWNDYLFRIQLSQSLIVAMEDEARWALARRTSQSPAIPTPDFLTYLEAGPLSQVRPEAVRITR
ncbi:MAG TPA: ABC transporter substrate-binding protein [Paucimonas sp.]|nr:ABC transporter substrate-binding protein [Paucimonas sp.]